MHWYVVQTKPNVEALVQRELESQLIPSYLPRERIRKRHVGRTVEAMEPLFRGYLFVAFDVHAERWKQINTTKGVLTILPRPTCPIPIRADEVAGLRDAEAQGVFRRGEVKPGENVRVYRGFLANQILKCVGSHGERVKLLWLCFGAPRVVEVRLADVTVAG